MENNCLHYASSVYRHMFLDKTLLQPARSLSLISIKYEEQHFLQVSVKCLKQARTDLSCEARTHF